MSSSNESINSELFRKQILDYSMNVKNYAKWFEISDVNKNEETYTTYKVVYRFLPKDLNESIKEVVVWKRFRDFKELNHILMEYHTSLHRRDKFPEFVKSKFFGRFDDKIIEERKEACLRLLQFVGSQSHLYRHEKFIEFLLDGKFNDHVLNNDKLITPNKSDTRTTSSTIPTTTRDYSKQIEKLALDLTQLMNDSDLKLHPEYDEISLFLAKSLRYVNSAQANENDKNHFGSYKLLKSAANTLDNFINDIDNQKSLLDKRRRVILKDLIKRLIQCSEEIEKNNLNLDKLVDVEEPPKLHRNESTLLNDWVLSEFNLLSNDFNSELAFICGNLFDLNFNFKFAKYINYKCFLMQSRHMSSEKFVLKRLQKSSNPNLALKSRVPLSNQVPYMCKLVRYYETDYTIFLLIEYHPIGRLFQYLDLLVETGDLFVQNLSINFDEETQSLRSLNRRKSSSLTSYNSVSCLSSLADQANRKMINRTQSLKDHSPARVELKPNKSLTKLTEIQLDTVKFVDDLENEETPQSSSSESSSSDSNKQSNQITIQQCTQSTSNIASNMFNLKLFKLNSDQFNTKLSKLINTTNSKIKTKILFKNQSEHTELHNKKNMSSSGGSNQVTSDEDEETCDAYVKRTKLWLAQLVCALKSLHRLGIVCKDLRPDNLLLELNGDLVMSYFSKWDLVDEQINQDAIRHFYVAPELCGLVNYSASEACDYWSLGVVTYEMLTMTKFSDLNCDIQVYIDNIIFPEKFNNETAKDLIRKVT